MWNWSFRCCFVLNLKPRLEIQIEKHKDEGETTFLCAQSCDFSFILGEIFNFELKFSFDCRCKFSTLKIFYDSLRICRLAQHPKSEHARVGREESRKCERKAAETFSFRNVRENPFRRSSFSRCVAFLAKRWNRSRLIGLSEHFLEIFLLPSVKAWSAAIPLQIQFSWKIKQFCHWL